MSRAPKLVSVQDYLAAELDSPVKREYVGGAVYAMSGGRNRHNLIAGNAFGFLFGRLHGKPCRPYNSDTKIRVRFSTHTRFYYPDTSVICRSNPPEETYQDEPVVVIEVPSKSTRRADQGEKREAYLTLPSLQALLLVEQTEPGVLVYRRTQEGFVSEQYRGIEAVIPLGYTELPLAELYDGVEFGPEPEPED